MKHCQAGLGWHHCPLTADVMNLCVNRHLMYHRSEVAKVLAKGPQVVQKSKMLAVARQAFQACQANFPDELTLDSAVEVLKARYGKHVGDSREYRSQTCNVLQAFCHQK